MSLEKIEASAAHPYTHDLTVTLAVAATYVTGNQVITAGTILYLLLRCYSEWLSIAIKRKEITK